MKWLAILLCVLAFTCDLARAAGPPAPPASPPAPASAPDFIKIAPDNAGFVRASSSPEKFVPWGLNYDRDHKLRLLEDYWDKDWSTVEEDFREMKDLGANVVRVHLQFGKFMNSPSEPNTEN